MAETSEQRWTGARSPSAIRRLSALSAGLVGAETEADIRAVVLAHGAAIEGSHAVGLYLIDDRRQELVLTVGTADDETLGRFARIPFDADLPVCEAARTGRPVVVATPSDFARYGDGLATQMVVARTAGLLCQPLPPAGAPVGVLAVAFSDVRPLTAEDLDVAEAVAAQLSVAIRGARLRRVEDELRAVLTAETMERLSRSLDLEDQLDALAGVLVPRLADWFALSIRTPDGPRAHAHHNDPARRALAEELFGRYGMYRLTESGDPGGVDVRDAVLLPELSDGLLARYARDDDHLETLRSLGLRSAMIVPLLARGRVLGVLALITSESGRIYDEDDLRLAREVAARASLAVDNTLLLARHRQISVELQHSLLPSGPLGSDRLEVAARYLPGVRDLEVGGDWYDSFPLEDGRWILVVGDVVGRGLEAAAAMGQLRNAVRALADGEPTPVALLGRLDRFAATGAASVFSTIAVVELSADGDRIRTARAGHPPPLLLHPDGRVTVVGDGARPPLAVRGVKEPAPVLPTPFADGDILLLYTDGLVERRGESIDGGIRRLAAMASALAEVHSLDVLVDRLVGGMLGGAVDDDVCVLVARHR
ncbi:MAG: SpoIIE family protein phosphatase [Acidimicrobiales bacterium]|jgi:serine phosphatase RsbU (regulator of sigma subunit)|nr:SpoIIE family protein phosphatase [Acidimicrobiales bacterium]